MPLNIYQICAPFMKRFRGRRFSVFKETLAPTVTDRVLDVGGYPGFWTQYEPVVKSIDCLNIHETAWNPSEAPRHGIRMMVGNGCDLAFPGAAYDILFSNSVIEHVGGWEDQQAFAREARRVGNALWIQTPAHEGPLEPHYVGLYIHHLPKNWQVRLIRWITFWGWTQRPTRQQIQQEVDSIRLLTRKEMETLFPDCEILTERLLGIFPKSYIAVRRKPAE